jgi:hypothetical protein
LGRFIQADTLVPDPADPQSLNRFAYVRNNPLNRIDPGGQADVGAGDVGSCDDSFCSAELQELYARWKAAKYQILSFRAYLAARARHYLYQKDPGALLQDYETSVGADKSAASAAMERIAAASYIAEYYPEDGTARDVFNLIPPGLVLQEMEEANEAGDVSLGIGLYGLATALLGMEAVPAWNPNRPGTLQSHFDKHGMSLGITSVAEYDASARQTVALGDRFNYIDRISGQLRVGYYDRASNRFTALSVDEQVIYTHFAPKNGVGYIIQLPSSDYAALYP